MYRKLWSATKRAKRIVTPSSVICHAILTLKINEQYTSRLLKFKIPLLVYGESLRVAVNVTDFYVHRSEKCICKQKVQ